MNANIYTATEAYNTTNTYQKTSAKQNVATEKNTAANTEAPAATYTKAERTKVNGKYVTLTKQNQEIVTKLKAESDARAEQFRSLVEDMLFKQGKTVSLTDNIYAMLRKGEIEVTPEVQAQAKKDIAEDGYWGVEQTSERLFSFAKAISGDNTEMADKLIAAVEKGFKQATKTWGDELPDLCKKTLDATIEKLNAWKESMNKETEDLTDAATDAFLGQAGNTAAAK